MRNNYKEERGGHHIIPNPELTLEYQLFFVVMHLSVERLTVGPTGRAGIQRVKLSERQADVNLSTTYMTN